MAVGTMLAALMFAQASMPPVLRVAMSAQQAGPEFVLECQNPEAHPIPETESLSEIARASTAANCRRRRPGSLART